MPLPVTTLYAGLLGLIAVALAAHAGKRRVEAGVSLGDGGKPRLIEGMRRQANFVEFVPLILVLLAIIELNGAPRWWLHTLGAALVAARILHPFGLHHGQMRHPLRMVGTIATFATLLATSVTALWQVVR